MSGFSTNRMTPVRVICLHTEIARPILGEVCLSAHVTSGSPNGITIGF